MTRIVIVGAGIGGIATALALRRAGIDHVVLEQAPGLTEVGAGIQLSPNGTRILDWLGVGAALRASAVEPASHVFRHWRSGETLLELPLGAAVRETFAAPYLHAHRADLLAAMLEALGDRDLRLGRRVVAVRQDAGGVEAVLEDGAIERGSILVGADGIHSLVRDSVFAPAAPPAEALDRGAGDSERYAAWRGLVPGETATALGIERRSYIWLGPGRSVVLYYVSGGRLLNWIGIGKSDQAERESWSATGSLEALLADYAGWHPQIVGLMAATARPFVTRLLDREPLPSWVSGRVVLLGDAAHAMLPYHAQGAVQSLEDAWVLARSIALASNATADPASTDAAQLEALHRYQRLRRDRATQVQAYSRAAQDWYHVSDPVEVARRDERFRAVARRAVGRPAKGRSAKGRSAKGRSANAGFSSQQEWLYAYDAEKAALGEDDQWRAMKWR